mgnify:CR=1 FL=1
MKIERKPHLIKGVHPKTWERFVKQAKIRGLKLGYYLDELVK